MNIFMINSDGNSVRIYGKGISAEEGIKRMEEVFEIVTSSHEAEEAIGKLIESATVSEISGDFVCISPIDMYLRLHCRNFTKGKVTREMIGKYNLKETDNQTIDVMISNELIQHRRKKAEMLRQSG